MRYTMTDCRNARFVNYIAGIMSVVKCFGTISVIDGDPHERESHTNWLREHMRDHIANHSALDSAENVLSFQRSPNSKINPGAAALDVVYQAAELIRDVDNYATERNARAETLARQAIEKLKIAHDCVDRKSTRLNSS